MKQNVIVELSNGRKVEATLARTLKADDNEIELILEGKSEKQTLSLSKVSTVQFINQPGHILPSQEDYELEEVETFSGGRYHVRIPRQQKFQAGFYGLSLESDKVPKLIFFTFHEVRMRRQLRPVGEILQEKGYVTPEAINEVLKEQEHVRNRRIGEIIAANLNLSQGTIEKAIQEARETKKIPQNLRIGDVLVAAGLVTREQVEEALASQEEGKKKRIGDLLVQRGLVTEEQILEALATKFQMRFVNLNEMIPNQKALTALSSDMVQQMQVFPIEAHDDRIVVATSKPTDVSIVDTLRFYANRRIDLVVAPAKQISEAINKYYAKAEDQVEDIIGEMAEDAVSLEEELEVSDLKESDSQIIKLLNKILVDAYTKGASDIHFEPGIGNEPIQIRYRIDGICYVVPAVSG